MQVTLAEDPNDCHFGQHPTLNDLREVYGPTAAPGWVIPELFDLSQYCGVREKMPKEALKECARLIALNYGYLKVSELMLFFSRFKAGAYGRFYGVVDPMVIMEALRTFIRERGTAYGKHEAEEAKRRRDESAARAITYEEYLRRKALSPA